MRRLFLRKKTRTADALGTQHVARAPALNPKKGKATGSIRGGFLDVCNISGMRRSISRRERVTPRENCQIRPQGLSGSFFLPTKKVYAEQQKSGSVRHCSLRQLFVLGER